MSRISPDLKAVAVADPAAATAVVTETQGSAALTVTNAINTVTNPSGDGLDATGSGEIDALFAEVKVDLDANKVVVDKLVLESTDYKATIDALIVDVAAMRTTVTNLITALENAGVIVSS